MILKGNPVSPGIVVNQAYLYRTDIYDVPESYFKKGQENESQKKFESALMQANLEIDRIIASFAPEESDKAKIFIAHKEVLNDEEILERIHEAIVSERKQPDFAVKSVFAEFIALLGASKDELIAARTADLCDVRNRLLRILGGTAERRLDALPGRVIVVAHDLLPSDTATIDRKNVAGIVTESGSSTSHTAIIARSYRIPAILGVPKAMEMIPNGALLSLDAETGVIVVSPDKKQITESMEKGKQFQCKQKATEKYLAKPAVTADGQQIEIGLNISSDQFRVPVENYDYVGLFRTEFLYMESHHLPTEEEQFQTYKRVLENAGDKIVTLRTLDIGGDKTLSYMELPKEENPFLGNRALRLCFENEAIFTTQLRAALRASAFGNLQIMFPMVGSIDDIHRAKAFVEAVKKQLRMENQAFDESIKLGIMIEIPSIAAIADLAAQVVDFASVGTNDLIQYLCAVDRMNSNLSAYYQSLSPAVLRVLGFIFEQFNARNKPVSVCGELGGDPIAAVIMIGLGLRKLSMSAANLARVKAAIANITMAQARVLGESCKNFATEEEVKAYANRMIAQK